jgi:hypothetical protein
MLLGIRPLFTLGDEGTADGAALCGPEASFRLFIVPMSLLGMPSHDLEPCSRWVGAILDSLSAPNALGALGATGGGSAKVALGAVGASVGKAGFSRETGLGASCTLISGA